MENTSTTLVTILISGLLHRVQIAKSVLANHGIISFIFDENIDLAFGRSFIEGIKLKVNTADVDRAKKILAESFTEDK